MSITFYLGYIFKNYFKTILDYSSSIIYSFGITLNSIRGNRIFQKLRCNYNFNALKVIIQAYIYQAYYHSNYCLFVLFISCTMVHAMKIRNNKDLLTLKNIRVFKYQKILLISLQLLLF